LLIGHKKSSLLIIYEQKDILKVKTKLYCRKTQRNSVIEIQKDISASTLEESFFVLLIVINSIKWMIILFQDLV